MAANRESTGLQVALILFVMMTVVLAVTTFVYYKAADAASKKATSVQKQLTDQQDTFTLKDREVLAYQYMITGQGNPEALKSVQVNGKESEDYNAIQVQYDELMGTFAAIPEESRNFTGIPKALLTMYQQRNKEVKQLEEQIAEKNKQIVQVEQQAATDKKAALDAQAAKAAELEAERTKFNEARKTFVSTVAARDQAATSKDQQIEATNNTLAQERQQAIAANSKSQRNIANLKEKLEELKGETFEIPDGRITWVNQRDGIVWISVGLADGLRRQTTFSIYNQDENGIDAERSKGAIEVTRLIDQHLAEATIIGEASLSNPILPGDVIFSPIWRPGRRLGFALAGLIDIDDDGKSDRDLVRNLITMSGGSIHAEAHDDGNIEGAITHNTRYVVIGGKPTESSDLNALKGYSKILDDARAFGTQELTLDQLLSLMGWTGQARTVTLGRGARAEDFLPDFGSGGRGVSTGTTADSFRKRSPRVAPGRKSSYGN